MAERTIKGRVSDMEIDAGGIAAWVQTDTGELVELRWNGDDHKSQRVWDQLRAYRGKIGEFTYFEPDMIIGVKDAE